MKKKGITIPVGSIDFTHEQLAKETNITVRQLSTVIKHLTMSGELSVKRYHDFSVFTILQWDKYQGECKSDVSQMSDKCKSDVAPNKNKRIKEYKNVYTTNKFKNFEERSYNYDELEQRLLEQ